jgi:hypothetical protein
MTELQKLGIQRILDLSKEAGEVAISTTAELMNNKTEFNADKHTFPISQKAREIEWWATAILDSTDDD